MISGLTVIGVGGLSDADSDKNDGLKLRILEPFCEQSYNFYRISDIVVFKLFTLIRFVLKKSSLHSDCTEVNIDTGCLPRFTDLLYSLFQIFSSRSITD